MNTESPAFSAAFQRLYCDASVYEYFSANHPIRLTRILPFQADDPVLDDARVLAAEAACLANPDEAHRRAVIEAMCQCGLLATKDAACLTPVLDEEAADFFELLGEIYANAGMFICALRWFRESIIQLESHLPGAAADQTDVYASVGYCLYSLGLHAEAVAWTRPCLGPVPLEDAICRAVINYEAQLQGGCVQGMEGVNDCVRYVVSAFDPAAASQLSSRLKLALSTAVPFQKVYLEWIGSEAPAPEIQPEGYPFRAERNVPTLIRHRMNLLFALCAQADDLAARGFVAEARRLLREAALLEPQAEFVQERLKAI